MSGIIGKVIYLARGSMADGHWGAGIGGIGHQMLLKVTNKGHLNKINWFNCEVWPCLYLTIYIGVWEMSVGVSVVV